MGALDLNWAVGTHNVAPPITALGLPAIAGYIYCRDFCVGEDMVMKRRDFLMLAAAGSLLPQTIARAKVLGRNGTSRLWCRFWRGAQPTW
jgi:hypothetical protein